MINIGEISKPSVSESPVRPKRSTSDGELVTPADSVELSTKVSTPYKKDPRKAKKQSKTDNEVVETTENQQLDVELYDETGHQEHHGGIDLKA